jgi:2'-5' RNA ligase
MTVLSVIPGSASWRGEIRRLPVCRAVVDEVLRGRRSFSVKFRGVTLSPEAVLIQGFPQGDGLARLREKLRAALRARGLGENLDRRYAIATAHLTVMRFSHPPVNWRRLLDFLQTHRQTDFGKTCFRLLQLIWGDWCASAGVTRTLREYALDDPTGLL